MFSLGLVLLVWGSGLFVDSAVSLANRFRLPEVLIGATIVSLGTTLPETLFSTMASVKGYLTCSWKCSWFHSVQYRLYCRNADIPAAGPS